MSLKILAKIVDVLYPFKIDLLFQLKATIILTNKNANSNVDQCRTIQNKTVTQGVLKSELIVDNQAFNVTFTLCGTWNVCFGCTNHLIRHVSDEKLSF